MAGGRRNLKGGSFKHHSHSDDRHELPPHPQAVQPKHIPVPELGFSELSFEADALLLGLFAMAGQYINLFKSVFWLPYSHTEYALNYYLIDYYVLAVNVIMIGRRLPVCILKKLCSLCFSSSHRAVYMLCINVIVASALISALLFCFYHVILEHGIVNVLYLIYPSVLQGLMLGPSQFLELTREAVGHQCSLQAEVIRSEVETLRSDLNLRLRKVAFNCIIDVYHATYLPCKFAPGALHYDHDHAMWHAIWTAVGCLTLYTAHCYPPRYCDTLHRAALHLGRWQRVDTRNVPYSTWTETAMWNQGALVKHSKEMFKAEGISNAAEPGYGGHSRFYWLFKNPATAAQLLFLIQLMLVAGELGVMVQSSAWHELVSMQLLILVHCRTLYSATRAYFVLKRIYHEERALIAKFTN